MGRVLLVLVFALALVGCSTWRPLPPAAYEFEDRSIRLIPGRARLLLRDGTEIVAEDLTIARDSVRATRIVSIRTATMSSPWVERRSRLAIATSELDRVEDYEASVGETVAAYFVSIAVALGGLVAVATSTN